LPSKFVQSSKKGEDAKQELTWACGDLQHKGQQKPEKAGVR